MPIPMPKAIVLPEDDCKRALGIDPVIIAFDDVTSKQAWYRLSIKHDATLDAKDFKDPELYEKYWFLSLGLLEHSVILIGGYPGGGKSLFMAYFTHKMHTLFGKRATLDWTPPEPKYFGDYFSINDDAFLEKVINDFNRLAAEEQDNRRLTTQEDLEKLILYNTIFGLDECDAYADKASRTNLTKLISRIVNRRRHTYTCLALVLNDIERFDQLILKQVTHKVTCIKEGHYPGVCSILIQDDRKGGTGSAKWLFLRPARFTHLWSSYNIPAMTHSTIDLNPKPKKKEKA